MTQRAVFSPFYPVSDKIDVSHRAGWARYWANELKASLITTSGMPLIDAFGKGDTLYAYHGMEFRGQMNLQSGLTDEILARVQRLLTAAKRGAEIVSLDGPMPNYGKLLAERGMDPTSADKLSKLCLKAPKMELTKTDPEMLIMGDSHSLSMYLPGSAISREDGQTMHGALAYGLTRKLGDLEFTRSLALAKCKVITVYYGNIDIRHHLHRQLEPMKAAKELVAEYMKQLCDMRLLARGNPMIEVVLPLPIENECRAIPKSGWYKGTPFAGSWRERDQLRKEMARLIRAGAKKHGFLIYDHPKHFTNQQGELSFDCMEQPRSVHIRPAEYRLIQEDLSWQP